MNSGLNRAQLAAVYTSSGPLLVLAGAGTGKTRVVTYRLAELIQGGVRPSRILAVTFTNKAAREMQSRAATLLGKKADEKPEISTFHSLCVRILRRQITHLGYPAQFAIYDRGDQESLARGALREVKASDAMLRPGDLISQISRWKNALLGPSDAALRAVTPKEVLAAAAYRRYQNTLRAAGAVDFDDLLMLTQELFQKHPDVKNEEAGRFDHLMIDEYQDTNAGQYHIVKALAEGHRNLCVVGDDDQSIYAWRGAEVTHILRFKQDWPDAKVVRLETNYRSSREILEWANRVIAFNKTRHDKVLQATFSGEKPRIMQFDDEVKESKGVIEDIKKRISAGKREPRDFAVLFRTNDQPRLFEEAFRRAKIPYVLLGGQSFFDRKEIRDLLAYLRVVANPRDEVSLLRVINTPARGIGTTTIRRLLETAVGRKSSVWDMLSHAAESDKFNTATRKALTGFRELIERFRREVREQSLVRFVRGMIGAIDYQTEIARNYPKQAEQEMRWNSVQDLVNAVGNYVSDASGGKTPSLVGFLQDTTLDGFDAGQDKEAELKSNRVALMTLHSAKGLEFPEVYLVGMEEGILPHRKSIADPGEAAVDEERRLCYVGVTRAQRRLTLSLANHRQRWGKARPTIASRFLYEITGQADNPNYLAAKRGQRRPARGAASKAKR